MKEELLAAGVLPEERRLQVAAVLRRDLRVRVEDLAERFAVSGETIRRDLKALEDRGVARRVYGGAVSRDADEAQDAAFAPPPVPFPPVTSSGTSGRPTDPDLAVAGIAAVAASLVEPGETVILDLGSAALETARALPLTFTGRVLCASVQTAALLATRKGVEVHLAGGRLRQPDLACVDDVAAGFFDRFFAHRAFLAVDGVDARAGLTCQNLDEIPLRRAMLRQSAQCYVLAESAKLGAIAVGRLAPVADVAGIITDAAAGPAVVRALESAGTRVIVAPAAPRLE
ncbi:MAG TPA: DeoR/GlpR family DNA-binding transcription regulator [Actinocrinis sp.]|uniref:DeoR/GlpR family DNA-binding transcription regulator n=1 Tax=Actinocrinis sp. TaxID=1920516 RepID=UPI002DDD7F87|nr:DeoR/GlpR family DNA-binding transcription regulator [Actinocrinis sp.]HEV2346344.1 DeoR/GlpR family DNA-binding transcription regulator [Actinocrinis sp.]